MPRDASGNMTLTAGNPVLAGTPIDPLWANMLTEDLRSEIQQSLSRQGKGGMVAPLRTQDGTALAPAHSFTNDTDCGMYLGAANEVRLAVAGADVVAVTAGAVAVTGNVQASGGVAGATATISGGATVGGTLQVTGTVSAATPTAANHLATKAYVDALCAIFGFGSNAGGGAGPDYMIPGFSTAAAGSTEVFFVLPTAGTVMAAYAFATANTDPMTTTVTVRKNGVDTAMVLSLPSGTVAANNTANTFAVVAGDRISVKLTSNAVGNYPDYLSVTLKLVPSA